AELHAGVDPLVLEAELLGAPERLLHIDRIGPAPDLQHQSALIPADLMNGHHFSISALWCAASASGVCFSLGRISCPRSCRRLRTPSSAAASTIAALSRATTGDGVARGTQSPCQTAM